MRWENKHKKKYQIGDSRVVKKFLFFPIKIGNHWRWLEKALIRQTLNDYEAIDPSGGFTFDSYKWYNIEWLN